MSVEAMKWVLNDACWNDEHGGMRDVPPHLVAPLIALANQADEFGHGAYPSQATLAWNTRKSPRGVRKDLREMLELGLIALDDQRLVDHIPADARPVVYRLPLDRCRPPRLRGRNLSTTPQEPGSGTTVPPAPGQRVPPAHDRPEPDDRAEPQYRPEPDDRPSSSGPEQMDRNHSSARPGGSGTTVPVGTGTTVPPTPPSTQKMTSSSSSTTDPSSLVDKYARSVAIIRRHLGDEVDDDQAAALADWIMTTYRVAPALLGAYVRRVALAGDLAGVLAEHRAGARADPARPASLIALDQRAGAAARLQAETANALRGEARRARHSEVLSQIRPTRRTKAPPAGGPGPPATAAS